MIDHPKPYFDHRYTMPAERPGIYFPELTLTKTCRRCGAEFETRCRVAKWCPACSPDAKQAAKNRANQAAKAQRQRAKALANPHPLR